MQRKPCGKHVQLASNDAVRISQCPCGSVYLTLIANGVTVKLSEEGLKNATRGLMTALDKVEEAAQTAIN